MEILLGGLCLIIGLVAGIFIGKMVFSRKQSFSDADYRSLEHQKVEIDTRIQMITGERDRLLQDKVPLDKRIVDLERTTASFETEKLTLEKRLKDQKEEIEKLHQELTLQFENLANKIFKENSTTFRESSEKNIATLLTPLKEKIGDFQKKVEDVYGHESRERFALKAEIEKIVVANQTMTETAGYLTRALRGDVKAQGNWGEIVLERILEASGLREGEEYVVQGKDLGLADSDGKRLQPDVIVNLPDNKHIIIDSKVSLIYYDRLISEPEQDKKTPLLNELVSSIYTHVDSLSGKKYQHLEMLLTPDFVLMFVPIEGAFSVALQADKALHSYAWNKSVVIVSPTTLMATLRTVSSLWKIERQNRNAQTIAKESGLLYDKFVGFIEDLHEVGSKLKGTQQAYEGAMNKLSEGKGNLVRRVERLKQLGARTEKNLPPGLLADGEEATDS